MGRPPKHDKAGLESKAHTNGNTNGIDNSSNILMATTSNGHSPVKKKMEIHNVINGDTEGEEMTSHDDDEDVRMEEGTEDDHEDEDEEEDEEVDHEEDGEEEEHNLPEQQGIKNRSHSNGIRYSQAKDVEMVNRHRHLQMALLSARKEWTITQSLASYFHIHCILLLFWSLLLPSPTKALNSVKTWHDTFTLVQ